MDTPLGSWLNFSDLQGWSEAHQDLSCALDAIAGSHPACSMLCIRWTPGATEPTLWIEFPRNQRKPRSKLQLNEASPERLFAIFNNSAQAVSMAHLLRRLAPAFANAGRANFKWAQPLTERGDGTLGLAESARFDNGFPDGFEPHSEAAAELLGASCTRLADWAPQLALGCLHAGATFLEEPARGACLALGSEFEAEALEAPLRAQLPLPLAPKRRL